MIIRCKADILNTEGKVIAKAETDSPVRKETMEEDYNRIWSDINSFIEKRKDVDKVVSEIIVNNNGKIICNVPITVRNIESSTPLFMRYEVVAGFDEIKKHLNKEPKNPKNMLTVKFAVVERETKEEVYRFYEVHKVYNKNTDYEDFWLPILNVVPKFMETHKLHIVQHLFNTGKLYDILVSVEDNDTVVASELVGFEKFEKVTAMRLIMSLASLITRLDLIMKEN